MLVDIHTHLDDKKFEKDLNQVIERAKKAGVRFIINNGLNPESNRKTLELSKKYALIKPALGFHPTELSNFSEEKIIEEIEFIKKNRKKIVALGEIGLDYHWIKDGEKREFQRKIFERLVGLAEEIEKPMIIHSRNAEEDVLAILKEKRAKKLVLHAFGGGIELAKEAEKKNYYFSIPPRIVFDSDFQLLVKNINISRLLTETDSPYLAPIKGQRNEPAFVSESIRMIAQIKELEEEEVKNIIFKNYTGLFSQ